MPNDLSQIRRAAFATSLRRCYLFSELSAQDLQCIASFVVQKRLGKGECLFREGAPFEGFYVVDEGAISVHRVNASGKMQVIHVFRAGESFAEAALAENTGYPADALALEQTRAPCSEDAVLGIAAEALRTRVADAWVDEPPPSGVGRPDR